VAKRFGVNPSTKVPDEDAREREKVFYEMIGRLEIEFDLKGSQNNWGY